MTPKPVTSECCPPFDPEGWHDKMLNWDQKPFVRSSVCTLFYMPLNFGSVIKRLMAKTDQAGATLPDWLCLSDHTSRWNMDIYLAVDKPVPGADNRTLSGKFFSRVYEGPFKDTGKWTEDFKSQAQLRGLTIAKWYMWYTTCPKCARKYGKNYVVIIAEVN